MIPEKIQSFRKILERNNLITVLCLLLVLVSFILNYLERRETLGKQLEFSYYVATDGEVIPASLRAIYISRILLPPSHPAASAFASHVSCVKAYQSSTNMAR